MIFLISLVIVASGLCGAIAQIFFSQVSLERFRWRLRIVYRKAVVVYRVKTKGETNIRNRYVAETHTDKRKPK